LKSTVGRAGAVLRALGRQLRDPNLESRGRDFLERSNRMRPREMSVADVQSWTGTLGNAMATVRASLRRLQ